MVSIFNSADEETRQSKRITIRPIDDKEDAIAKLKRLSTVSNFAAKLRQPNPYTRPQYQEWWDQLHGTSNAETINVTWDNKKDPLGLDESSPITRSIEMSADAYGTWKASGVDKQGRPRQIDSGEKALKVRAPFRIPAETIKAVADFINSSLRRRGAQS